MNSAMSDTATGNSSLKEMDINSLLQPLEKSIKAINESLTQIRSFYEEKLSSQKREIDILRMRLNVLESRCGLNKHILQLHQRKLMTMNNIVVR